MVVLVSGGDCGGVGDCDGGGDDCGGGDFGDISD